MRNSMVQDRVLRERARFIESIDQAAILALASSHHQNAACRFFRPSKHGGFNVCFFVEFEDPDARTRKHRWVVRIPLSLWTPAAWIDEKVEVEVATMKHVALKTKIPVPKVHAYSFSGTSPIGLAFIIMDFIDGQNLAEHGFKDGEKWINNRGATDATRRIYQQLAEVFVELRQQEFPRIGALGFDPRGPSESNPAGVHVYHRPLSIEIVMQDCEGQNPGEKFPANKTFATASEYIQSLLWLSDNELERSTNPDVDRVSDGGARLLYAVQDFRRFVTEKWFDPSKDEGPFVLMHGDLHNHYSNLLWDQDLNLVGVIDWEFSQVVPLQFLTPPVWLDNTTASYSALHPGSLQKEVGFLREALHQVEEARGSPGILSSEWAKMETWCHPLVVSTLFRPNDIYDVYWGFVSWDKFQGNEHHDQVEVGMRAVMAWEKSDTVQAWMKEKRVVQDRYYEEEDVYVYLDEENGESSQRKEAS